MALTFGQILARANEASPSKEAHIWIDYADGKRGYAFSLPTRDKALRYMNTVEGEQLGATAYDREGNWIE